MKTDTNVLVLTCGPCQVIRRLRGLLFNDVKDRTVESLRVWCANQILDYTVRDIEMIIEVELIRYEY